MKKLFALLTFCILFSGCNKDKLIIKKYSFTPSPADWLKTSPDNFNCTLMFDGLNSHIFEHGNIQFYMKCSTSEDCWIELPYSTASTGFNAAFYIGRIEVYYFRTDGANWPAMPSGLEFKMVLTFEEYDK